MKKILLFVLILFPVSVLISQVNATRFWIGGSSVNWNDGANWSASSQGAASNDYPSGAAAIAKFETTNNQVTVNTDITLKQMVTTGSATVGTFFEMSASGGSTLTLGHTNGNGQIIQINKASSGFKFQSGFKLVVATAADKSTDAKKTSVIRAGQSNGIISFLSGSTLTISAGEFLNLSSAGATNNFYFKGTLVGGSAASKFQWQANCQVNFANTFDDSGFSGTYKGANTANNSLATINANMSGSQLILTGSGNAVINAGGSFTASGNVNTATGRITVKSGKGTATSGSLVATANTNEFDVTFIRELDDKQADNSTREWTLLGVPVTGETLADLESQSVLSTKDGKVGFGEWDNAAEAFDYYTIGATKTLTPGKGYLATVDSDAQLEFQGTFVKGTTVSQSVTAESGTYGPWNMVGNPYLAYLMLTDNTDSATDSFLEVNKGNINDAAEAAYVWDGTEYDIIAKSTNTINHIAPGDAFFIKVRTGGGGLDAMNMNFKETMQKVNKGAGFNAASSVEGASGSVSRFNILMKDEDNKEHDKLYFYFGKKASKGLDPGYDVAKFFRGPESRIFTRLIDEDHDLAKGTDFTIQALSDFDLRDAIVPLGIETSSSKIKLSVFENSLDHLYNVYLEDRLKNTIVRFDSEIELDFEEPQTGVGRFYLHFTDGMIPELPTDGDDFRIYKVSNNEIRLMGEPDKIYKAKVFDFSGRLIDVVEFKHRVNIDKLDNQSIKILTIEDKDKKLTKKFQLK